MVDKRPKYFGYYLLLSWAHFQGAELEDNWAEIELVLTCGMLLYQVMAELKLTVV